MTDDKVLFEKIQQDDRQSFEALFKKYYASFCVVAYRYVEDKELAKDIAQEVFIKLWDKRHTYNDIPSIKTFLYVLVKNACLNHIRNQKIREKHLGAIEKEGEVFFQQATIPEETYRQLEAFIEQLPPQSANIIRLNLKGFSNGEIAETLGVSINTVKTLKYNALRNMRDYFGKFSVATLLFLLDI
jgi:RNA polymerase sigma-70 factor (family 1)